MRSPKIFEFPNSKAFNHHPVHGKGFGYNSRIYRGSFIKEIEKYYGRTGLALKIFYTTANQGDPGDIPRSKFSTLTIRESASVVNIFNTYGLAPRIYDVVTLHNKGLYRSAYVVGYISGRCSHKQVSLVADKMRKYEKWFKLCLDNNTNNAIGGKWVDFEQFDFKPVYKEHLKNKLDKVANWGPWSNYQDIRGFYRGARRTRKRIKQMGLDKINFEGKTVLDLGCSGGEFARYADDQGAKYVMGVDTPKIAKVAEELSRYLGYHRIDFCGRDLTKDKLKLPKFDIILFFSMAHHVGYRKYLSELCNEMVIYEGNARTRDKEVEEGLTKDFSEFKIISHTTDLFDRPVGIARK